MTWNRDLSGDIETVTYDRRFLLSVFGLSCLGWGLEMGWEEWFRWIFELIRGSRTRYLSSIASHHTPLHLVLPIHIYAFSYLNYQPSLWEDFRFLLVA